MESAKYYLIATVITLVIIFGFIKSVESEEISVHDTTPVDEIVIATELLDKDLAIMVLGGIDYYVQECTPLTERGEKYRDKLIEYHNISEGLLGVNPTYIKGALSVTGYNCHEMYELITQIDDSNIVEEPEQLVDKEETISEK